MDTPEKKYFEDEKIVVTGTSVKTDDRTYKIANIAQVYLEEKTPSRIPGAIVTILGLVIIAVIYSIYQYINFSIYIGVVLFIVGVVMMLRAKTQYTVKISSGGLATDALVSSKRDYSKKIVEAIDQALTDRG
jgi:hypothetical protein